MKKRGRLLVVALLELLLAPLVMLHLANDPELRAAWAAWLLLPIPLLGLRDLWLALTPEPRLRPGEDLGEGPWRKGRRLVLRRGQSLPDRCLLTGSATEHRVMRRLEASHELVLLFALFPLPEVLGERFGRFLELALPISRAALDGEPQARRRSWRWIFAGAGLLLLFLLGLEQLGRLALLALALGILLLCYGVLRLRNPLRIPDASRIGDRFVWLRGVNPELLAELPEWRHGIREPLPPTGTTDSSRPRS